MREILFRGKRCDNLEWVEGYLLKECNYSTCSWNLGIEYKTDKFGKFAYDVAEIIPYTVGQFTGLTDKNGKKIFEGDLVKEQDIVYNGEIQIPGHIFSVVMRKGCWCVIPIYDTEEWDFLNSYLPFLEVIGNIHDNPELLGGTEHET